MWACTVLVLSCRSTLRPRRKSYLVHVASTGIQYQAEVRYASVYSSYWTVVESVWSVTGDWTTVIKNAVLDTWYKKSMNWEKLNKNMYAFRSIACQQNFINIFIMISSVCYFKFQPRQVNSAIPMPPHTRQPQWMQLHLKDISVLITTKGADVSCLSSPDILMVSVKMWVETKIYREGEAM